MAYRQRLDRTSGARSTLQADPGRISKAPEVNRTPVPGTHQQVYSNTSRSWVDASGNNLLYLPLDKLSGRPGPGALAAPVEAPAAAARSEHSAVFCRRAASAEKARRFETGGDYRARFPR